MIVTRALTRRFGSHVAVDAIDLEVRRAEIFGFLGPNGAGKSTMMKMLTTLLRPSAGSATVAGFDVTRAAARVRERIGVVFQEPSLDDRLTAAENLRFHALIYRVPPRETAARVAESLALVGLQERRDDLVRTLSGGTRRRLEIARGFLHHPDVLFLDEPTLGLDPHTRRTVWTHVQHLRNESGLTVFMSTHAMEEAEICDRICIIDQGRSVALDTPSALKQACGLDTVIVTGDDDLADEIAARYHIDARRVDGRLWLPMTDGARFVPRLANDLGPHITAIEVRHPSLDDVFIRMTGRGLHDADMPAPEDQRQERTQWASGG